MCLCQPCASEGAAQLTDEPQAVLSKAAAIRSQQGQIVGWVEEGAAEHATYRRKHNQGQQEHREAKREFGEARLLSQVLARL